MPTVYYNANPQRKDFYKYVVVAERQFPLPLAMFNKIRETFMSSNHIYYVYAYVRKDGTPYYIGKGKDDRAYKPHTFVSLPKDKTRIVFLETQLSEIGALALERRYIRWWGKKELGGVLLNITDGGEGVSGYRHSPESRAKMSKKRIDRNYSGERNTFYGKNHTEESRAKMREKAKNRTPWNKGKDSVYSEETLKKMSERKIGLMNSYKWWNNGQVNTRSPTPPGDGWFLGRLKR